MKVVPRLVCASLVLAYSSSVASSLAFNDNEFRDLVERHTPIIGPRQVTPRAGGSRQNDRSSQVGRQVQEKTQDPEQGSNQVQDQRQSPVQGPVQNPGRRPGRPQHSQDFQQRNEDIVKRKRKETTKERKAEQEAEREAKKRKLMDTFGADSNTPLRGQIKGSIKDLNAAFDMRVSPNAQGQAQTLKNLQDKAANQGHGEQTSQGNPRNS